MFFIQLELVKLAKNSQTPPLSWLRKRSHTQDGMYFLGTTMYLIRPVRGAHSYRLRSRGDNTFSLSVRLSVCLSVLSCLNRSVCLSVIKEHSRSKSCAQRSGAFNKSHRVFISRNIQIGWAFKIIVVSTGCAIGVDHAFNCLWSWFNIRVFKFFCRPQKTCWFQWRKIKNQ